MKERDFLEKIQQAIKADPLLQSACIFKHAETLTSGIPDLSITYGRTMWIEVKYLRKRKKLKDIVMQLQVITCNNLAQLNGGRAWVVVYEDDPKRLVIWQPRVLFKYLWPKFFNSGAVVSTPGVHVKDEPVLYSFNDYEYTPWQALSFYGAIYVHGHPHELVVSLIREAAATY